MASNLVQRALAKIDARPNEVRALCWSFAYFFFILACYFILRPVRDEMGVRSGVRNLPWLFAGTFVATLVIAPIYAFLTARLGRKRFIPLVYGFLLANILAFWALLTAGIAVEILAATFFVWLSVFNVLAVSILWSFMADVYSSDQAKRLYPTIAAGGSLGGFAGSATVAGMATVVGPANLLLIAAVLLGLAIFCALRLESVSDEAEEKKVEQAEKPLGGSPIEGLVDLLRSPYLLGIAFWVFALSLAGTFAYSMQAEIFGASGMSSEERTRLFGIIDMTSNLAIPVLQFLVARWVLKRFGVGVALGVLAVVFAVGFATLAFAPMLTVLVAFQIAQRAGQFAFSNPAREALWTVVDRDEKYKAKNIVDNAVFRGSDMVTASLFKALHSGAGLSLSTIALIGAPLMALWLGLSLWLGRAQARRAAAN